MMFKISRVKNAIVNFIIGNREEPPKKFKLPPLKSEIEENEAIKEIRQMKEEAKRRAQYGTQPVSPAAPGAGATIPQSTIPASQPPAGMTCPAGQKLMLDPQTNQWKCMPEATAEVKQKNIKEGQHVLDLIDLVEEKYEIRLDNEKALDLHRWVRDQDFTSDTDYYYAIEAWLKSRGYKVTSGKRISKKIKSQESQLLSLMDLAEEKLGIRIDNDTAVDLLREIWNQNIETEDDKLYIIRQWLEGNRKLPNIKDRRLPQETVGTEMVLTPVGYRPAKVIGDTAGTVAKKSQLMEFEKEDKGSEEIIERVPEPEDIFDWVIENHEPSTICERIGVPDDSDLLEHKDTINQMYLPSYKDQIMSSDFDELFDRKDPVIEEQEYDSEKDWGNKWLEDDKEDIYTENDGCGIEEMASGLTADKFGNKEAQYKFSIGDRVLFKATKDGRVKSGVIINMFSRQATIKADDGTITQAFVWDLLREAMQKNAQGLPQQLTWVWDDGTKDWKQVPVMSEWDTLMERRLEKQKGGQGRVSNRKGQQQQLKVGDVLESKQDGIRWTVVQMGFGDESVYIRQEGETKGGIKIRGDAWQVNYRLVPLAEVSLSVSPSSNYRSSPRGIMPGVASKKAQTQAQMEKTVPTDVTPVNPKPAPVVNRTEPLKPGEIPVILEDEEGESVKPKGKTEEESKAEEKVDLGREEKVKKDVETLRDTVINLANSVYSIEMSDNQVTDLMGKIMGFLSESISEVTLGRVQDIVGDLLPRKASKGKLSNRKGQTDNLRGRQFKYEDKIWIVKQVDRVKELVIVQEGNTGEFRYIPFATFNYNFEEIRE